MPLNSDWGCSCLPSTARITRLSSRALGEGSVFRPRDNILVIRADSDPSPAARDDNLLVHACSDDFERSRSTDGRRQSPPPHRVTLFYSPVWLKFSVERLTRPPSAACASALMHQSWCSR